jgi:hypothetical protein
MAVDSSVLCAWKDSLSREVEEIRSRIRPLENTLKRKQEQLSAVDQLLALTGDLSRTTQVIALPETNRGSAPPFLDCAADILRQQGGPLHYKALFARVRERGVHVPGRNPEANLLTRMNRDARFARVARGTYGLAGPDEARFRLHTRRGPWKKR